MRNSRRNTSKRPNDDRPHGGWSLSADMAEEMERRELANPFRPSKSAVRLGWEAEARNLIRTGEFIDYTIYSLTLRDEVTVTSRQVV